MCYGSANFNKTFIESEENTLHALAVFLRLLAVQLKSIPKLACDDCKKIEMRASATLTLLQAVHVNLLQRKWLLADMSILDKDGEQRDHEEMVDAIQELEQIMEQYHFSSKNNHQKMKVILKQISAHYHSAVKTIIVGNPSLSPPWRP